MLGFLSSAMDRWTRANHGEEIYTRATVYLALSNVMSEMHSEEQEDLDPTQMLLRVEVQLPVNYVVCGPTLRLLHAVHPQLPVTLLVGFCDSLRAAFEVYDPWWAIDDNMGWVEGDDFDYEAALQANLEEVERRDQSYLGGELVRLGLDLPAPGEGEAEIDVLRRVVAEAYVKMDAPPDPKAALPEYLREKSLEPAELECVLSGAGLGGNWGGLLFEELSAMQKLRAEVAAAAATSEPEGGPDWSEMDDFEPPVGVYALLIQSGDDIQHCYDRHLECRANAGLEERPACIWLFDGTSPESTADAFAKASLLARMLHHAVRLVDLIEHGERAVKIATEGLPLSLVLAREAA